MPPKTPPKRDDLAMNRAASSMTAKDTSPRRHATRFAACAIRRQACRKFRLDIPFAPELNSGQGSALWNLDNRHERPDQRHRDPALLFERAPRLVVRGCDGPHRQAEELDLAATALVAGLRAPGAGSPHPPLPAGPDHLRTRTPAS